MANQYGKTISTHRLTATLYWVASEQGLWTLTTMKTCWNWLLMLGMKGRAPGSWNQG